MGDILCGHTVTVPDGRGVEMSISKPLSDLIMSFGTGGMIIGGLAFRFFLSPKSFVLCEIAMQERADLFGLPSIPESCLNAIGANASGFDPNVLTIIGAALGGAIGWVISRK